MTRYPILLTFSRVAAVAALLVVSGCNGSTRGHSDRASEGREQPVRAVEAYNTPAYGREIQLVRPDGRRIRIDPHPPLPIDGAWSPDGTRIAFSGGEGSSPPIGARNLYTAAGDGDDVRLLYRGKASSPSWSPDGKWIAFSVDEGRGPWVVGADGHGARRVADLVLESGAWAAWSPDGKKLAVSGQDLKHGTEYDVGVYTVRVDGTGLHRLTRPLTRGEVADEAGIFDVEWAPDGTRIAFVRYSDSAPAEELDVVDANGRNERRIAGGDCPVWSPDGKRLAYSAIGGIAVVRPGRPGRLIAKQKGAGCPVWFADGHRILFFAGGPYVVNTVSASVRKATAADRKHVRLFQDAGQTFTKDGKFLDVEGDFDFNWQVVRILTLQGTAATFRWSDDYLPAWSPDRRKLLLVRLQKTEQVFIFDTVDRRLHRFAAGTNPAWSPDGNEIAFERKNHVFVARVRGGAARPIGKGGHPAWSPDGRFIAATGGGGPFVMSRNGERRRRIDVRAVESCEGGAEPPSGRPAWSHDGLTLTFSYWCEADQIYEHAVVARNEWRP